MSTGKRLLLLIAGFLPVGIIYFSTGNVKGENWLVPEWYIERFIPFSPSGIWLYLMFYVYIPYTYLTADESKIKKLACAFILSAVISGIIYVFFPSTILYPQFEAKGLSASLLNFVKQYDTEQNCFPSLHGCLITLCSIANFEKTKKVRTAVCIFITLLMYYSIIQVRRHVFIDLAAGIFLSFVVWMVFAKILKTKKGIGKPAE